MIEMDQSKVVFETHITSKGALKEGKEKYECPKCGGACFVYDSYTTPYGSQNLTFNCTDCDEQWDEFY